MLVNSMVQRSNERVTVDGKFLRLGRSKFYVKGFCYGPFAKNSLGEFLPEEGQFLHDLALMNRLGANTVRLYSMPSFARLDQFLERDLRVFLDVPWEKHRCIFEDWAAEQSARRQVLETAELARHPAVLAVSVVNELPNDVVRFYGIGRIEKFLNELADSVKQVSPECITTFANYPTTEFLQPEGFDLCSFNVYLHELDRLGLYFDRLQHIAGDRPLLLSEFGVDSIRQGPMRQAELLAGHIRKVFQHGLAGSIVFSYTDDWFTGGAQISDWGFGVTTSDREEKPAATALQYAWRRAPFDEHSKLPKVSIVVCAYNAGSTLHECLDALDELDYPDYEVILVDDGSTDATPQIAAAFPQFRCIRQSNHGLSHARNVGWRASTGEIVAYTDADCVVDRDWMRCLMEAMLDQDVSAIGGPNITPITDGWSAHCVAASPGNPSHVMFDDRHAEHIPGCNMAFRRDVLESLGGFDHQYRAAGDDVDLCWRLLDQGDTIGYAPGAFVWHHRRQNVRAYLKQQIGYGRAEALLHFMHPHRFGIFGRCSWHGRIYGSGTAGLPLVPERVYYGTFGFAPFQSIYRHNEYGTWACVTWLEWHAVAVFFLALGFLFWPFVLVSITMWSGSAALAIYAASAAVMPKDAPWWCRPLVGVLHLVQPPIRAWYRATYDLRLWRPKLNPSYYQFHPAGRSISPHVRDFYWISELGDGRETLLQEIVDEAKTVGWLGVFNNAWETWDVKLVGDLWHTLLIHTATEELGKNKRFTRLRMTAKPTLVNRTLSFASLAWTVAALMSLQPIALGLALAASAAALFQNVRSRQTCLDAATGLVMHAAERTQLRPADYSDRPEGAVHSPQLEPADPVSKLSIPQPST
jgi:glycosyltransferase involved in cell wall biosynthesis